MSTNTSFVNRSEKMVRRANRIQELKIPIQKQGQFLCDTCKSEKNPKFLSFKFDGTDIKVTMTIVCYNTRCPKARGRAYMEHYSLVPTKDYDDLLEVMDRSQQQYRIVNKSAEFYDKILSIDGLNTQLAIAIVSQYEDEESLKKATIEELVTIPGIGKGKAKVIKDVFPIEA